MKNSLVRNCVRTLFMLVGAGLIAHSWYSLKQPAALPVKTFGANSIQSQATNNGVLYGFISGTGASPQMFTYSGGGYKVSISGTYVGTLQFQLSQDGGQTWSPVALYNTNSATSDTAANSRLVTDGVLNSTTTLTSATATFTAADIGSTVQATGIPAGTTIATVTNATTVILSAAATQTASGVSVSIIADNIWFYVAPQGGDGILQLSATSWTSGTATVSLTDLTANPQRIDLVSLTPATRTATTTGPTLSIPSGYKAMLMSMNCTAASGTGGLTVSVIMGDPKSTGITQDNIGSAHAATGCYFYQLGPTASMGLQNGGAQDNYLHSEVTPKVIHGDATNYTYSLSVTLIPY